jgi:LPS export ABC transporter permease LptG
VEISGLANVKPRTPSNAERATRELTVERGVGWRDARVELHRRLAFPVACFAFALVAVPLGSQPRRGGRAAGSLIAVILIALYYLLLVIGAGIARQGLVSPAAGIWIANASLTLLALILLPRLEQIRGGVGGPRWMVPLRKYLRLRRRRQAQARAAQASKVRVIDASLSGNGGKAQADAMAAPSSGSFPRLMDLYIFRRFLWYFALLMAAFVFLFEAFTFFELLDDISKHGIPFLTVVNYFRYLTPYLAYNLAPLGALMAVLVTVGTMSKNNEIVAIKASGISLYRLAVPLFFGGLTLAAAMVFLDDVYLPYANQRQDALRNQIKGRPPQTYARPQRWIFGENSKIYNYDLFDPTQNLFGGLTVIELEPASFMVKRRIFATRAKWSETQNAWVLESGWVRDFSDGSIIKYERFAVTALPELTEPPGYFHREVRQAFQMSWRELRNYIEGLQRAGFDVSALKVQWHVKLAFPLIAPVSMLLAIPFAFLVGARGALGGVALGVGIGIAYWIVSRLLEAMGGVGQLPPLLAGWSPDIIFFFLGMYFFFKMPT